MIKKFNENIFIIDLIISAYNLEDNSDIQNKVKEEFNTIIPIIEIENYKTSLNLKINPNKFSISMDEIFKKI